MHESNDKSFCTLFTQKMKQNEYSFYNTIESKNSAEIIIKTILPFFKNVNSFLDLGCGVGAWSKEFKKNLYKY